MSEHSNGPAKDLTPPTAAAEEEPTPPQGTSGDIATPPQGFPAATSTSPVAAPVRRSSLSIVIAAALIVVGVVGLVLTLRSGHQAPHPIVATGAAQNSTTTVGHFASTVRSASGDCRSNADAKPGRVTRTDNQVVVSAGQITIEDGPAVASGPIGKTGGFTARSADGTRSWVGTITGTSGQGKSFLVSGNAADPAHSCTIEFTFTVTLDRPLP